MSRKKWEVDELSTHFDELLNATWATGPQLVAVAGAERAVLVHIDHWRLMQERKKPTLKEALLGPGPRGDIPIPSRKSYKMRPAPDFSDD